MPSQSVPAVTNGKISFFNMAGSIPACIRITCPSSVYQWTLRLHLRLRLCVGCCKQCFSELRFVCVYIYPFKLVFQFLWMNLRHGIAGSYGNLVLTFCGTSVLFSHSGCTAATPHQQCLKVPFHIFSSLCDLLPFDNSLLTGMGSNFTSI